jgi:dolichol-phosphate mannosyltransferase
MTSARADAIGAALSVPLAPPVQSRQGPLVSVLVPAKDEAENLPLFMEQAAAALSTEPGFYEVIVIDDGSVDDTWNVLQELSTRYPFLRAVRHRARRGIAESLRSGYLAARGSILVFYPADLQYKPEESRATTRRRSSPECTTG